MRIIDLLSSETIDLNVKAKDKTDVLKQAVKLMGKSGVINDLETYEKGVFLREEESTTGVGEGIAIPHCKSPSVDKPHLVVMVIPEGVDYDALDGEKVDLLFLIAAPNTDDNVHLDVLARLSNMLMHEEFKANLMKAKTKKEFLKVIDDAETEKKEAEANKETAKYPRILAATACPTGIAHTYMAQEALEKAAAKMGYTIKVETNGTGGQKNRLTDEEIEHADAIIVAADAAVETERFNGKHVIQCAVSKAIHNPEGLINEALDPNCPVFGQGKKAVKSNSEKSSGGSKFHIFYKHLMSGISHMIPFIVAGGILLAIAYMIDGIAGAAQGPNFGSTTIGAKIFHMLGGDIGLGLMLPVLGGFIAYDIAGRPGLVSGFIGGLACGKGQWSLLYWIMLGTGNKEWTEKLSASGAGFLGAIVAGFIAGYFTLWFKNKLERIPRTLEGVKDILIVPLTTTFVVAGALLLVNIPLSFINIGMNAGLKAIQEAGKGALWASLLLGALVSALMATDMGGPINKAAHYFVLMLVVETAQLAATDPSRIMALQLQAANIVGIMTPPVGIAFATWLFPQKFSKQDRMTSPANCVTGVCGITEGAIPFLVKDPVRVLISTITGAAVGGVVSVALGMQAIAPEGGTISFLVMGITFWKGLVAMLIGSLITALLLGFLKKDVSLEEAELGRWKGIPTQPVYNFFGKVGHAIAKPFKKQK